MDPGATVYRKVPQEFTPGVNNCVDVVVRFRFDPEIRLNTGLNPVKYRIESRFYILNGLNPFGTERPIGFLV